MVRYFVQLSYNGTNYCGWQSQRNATAVQAVINSAFSVLLRKQIDLVGCGRTDTGVHAINYIAHFDTTKVLIKSEIDRIIFKINTILPADIVIHTIYQVPVDAHARFSAQWRTYKYFITTNKEVFLTNKMTYLNRNLDVTAMNEASNYLLGTKDFTSFSKLHTDVANNLCTVTNANWELVEYNHAKADLKTSPISCLHMYNKQSFYVFTIVANRFLRNMVRALVGTLIEVGRGKISVDEFKQILDAMDRSKASSSAHAKGLYLVDVEYPKWGI